MPFHHSFVIDEFTGVNKFLSNFYEGELVWRDTTYPSAEHAFQAAKTLDTDERAKIIAAESPLAAKRLGRACTLKRNWEYIKLGTMKSIIVAKFQPKTKITGKLLNTGNMFLMEGNDWGDDYWGAIWNETHEQWIGWNYLGFILMARRAELAAIDAGWGTKTVLPDDQKKRPRIVKTKKP